MPPLVTLARRQGVKSRQIMYPEPDTGYGTDPTVPVGYLMPLAEESGFGTDQPLVEAPVFKGKRKPFGIVYGNIAAAGNTKYGLEFTTFLRVMRQFVGPSGYSRPFAGTTTLHRIFCPTITDSSPGSVQLQDESLETPTQRLRNRGIRINTVNIPYVAAGVAGYTVDWVGIGDEVQTDLIGTVNDDGYVANSYFNGFCKLNGFYLVGLQDFNITFNGNVTRGDAAFRGGIGASTDFGVIDVSGRIALSFAIDPTRPEGNMNFYNMAVNQGNIPIDVAWSNFPAATATQWCRIILPGVNFSRKGFRPGGANAKIITQDFRIEQNAAVNKIQAEKFGTIAGPYNIGASTLSLGLKSDGGATVVQTITIGAAITTDAIVTLLNASGTFNTQFVAENFMGRLMIRRITPGASFSVQVDTATVNSAHTVLGFDGVISTGFDDTEWLMEFYNGLNTSLATTV